MSSAATISIGPTTPLQPFKVQNEIINRFRTQIIDWLNLPDNINFLENLDDDTTQYVFKRCDQLTFKCKKIENSKGNVDYDISKPINLMGDKL